VYCDTTTAIGSPSTVTVCVPGISVVSDRNGSPSTSPSSTTELSALIGNRGLVISVGLENVGRSTSTR